MTRATWRDPRWDSSRRSTEAPADHTPAHDERRPQEGRISLGSDDAASALLAETLRPKLSLAKGTHELRRNEGHDRREARHVVRSERRRAIAVPADRRVRVPLELPHRRFGCAGRGDRLALRPALRLAQCVRFAARPCGRLVPAWP